MRWIAIRQLRGLRKLPVPPEALEAGRRRLLIVMADAPMAADPRFHAYVWKPALAAFVMVVFVAVSGGGVVYASNGALPGDKLYAVKLASEGVQEHLALSPERKFAVQAEHASLRLEETQELMARNGLDAQERGARVRKAITGYEYRLTAMNLTAATLVAEPAKGRGQKGLRAMEAAERMLDRHAELVASATDADPGIVRTVIEPIEGSIRLESDIYAFTRRERQDDGAETEPTDEENRWEAHRKERGDQLTDHLKRLRAGLEPKALEIEAEK